MAGRKKKTDVSELDLLDKAYTELTGRPIQVVRKHSGWAATICVLLILLLSLGLAAYFALFGSLLDPFLPMGNVTIAGIQMNGLTKQDAKEQLRSAVENCTTQPMTIQVLETVVSLEPASVGIAPDVESAVNDAFRSRSTGDFSLLPYLHLDTAVIKQTVEELGKLYNTLLVHTQCTVSGDTPSLEAGSAANATGKVLTVTLGKPGYGLDTHKLYTQILSAYNCCETSVVGACSVVDPKLPDLDSLYAQHYTAPVDAVMDAKTFEITPESYGYGFDLNTAKEQLSKLAHGETMTVAFQKIQPQVTGDALRSTLFCDVLGICKTPYNGSDTNDRNTNLHLACEAINGVVLLPGETFSYNNTLGERTPERGYRPAPSYINGLTVDSYGGGICQVSTTLYYCALLADLPIVERHTHGYLSDYIDPGMDASVSWGSADLRFTNNTNYPIRFEAYRADGYVNVKILGTDEKNYYIEMHYSIISTTPYETVYREMAPDNKEGYEDGDVIVTPYKGYQVISYKCKFDKLTKTQLSKELECVNTYKHRDKVICKIVSPGSATEPTGTTETTG